MQMPRSDILYYSSEAGLTRNCQIIKGQLKNEELLSSAVQGCDVVFSALGPSFKVSNLIIKDGTYVKPYRTIFKAMRGARIKRIFIMGTPSIAIAEDRPPRKMRWFVTSLKLFLRTIYDEVVATGELLDREAKDLDWTMYRVGFLQNKTGVTKAANFIGEGDWTMYTFRPDLATWILDEMEKERAEWARKKPALYSIEDSAAVNGIH